jgi:hypothetical protein
MLLAILLLSLLIVGLVAVLAFYLWFEVGVSLRRVLRSPRPSTQIDTQNGGQHED